MKYIFTIAIMVLLNARAFTQDLTIETEKQLNVDFSKFKTYYYASQVDDKLDEGYFFLNDVILKSNVRDAVDAELQGRGYKKNAASPDLIVNFRLFESQTKIKGYQDYGKNFWNMDIRQPEDTTTYVVKPGTLFISLVDRKNSNIVWQGFVSGLIDNKQFIKDESKIKEAVNRIFNKYGYRADNNY
jgi:hypothetical protein